MPSIGSPFLILSFWLFWAEQKSRRFHFLIRKCIAKLENDVRKYAFMIFLCAIYMLVVAELLNGFLFAHFFLFLALYVYFFWILVLFFLCSVWRHIMIRVHVHCWTNSRTLAVSACVFVVFLLLDAVASSHRLISGSFIEHQLESINENTSYDFAVHGSFTPRMVHCLQLAGNKKRKFNFRFEILYAKLDVNL